MKSSTPLLPYSPFRERPTVDPADFKCACAQFTTGVAVAAAREGNRIDGVTVSSFTSVSLDPPTILFCLHQRSGVLPLFVNSRRFGLSILAEDQQYLSDRFATATERVLGAKWRDMESDTPTIDGALAALECEIAQAIQVAGHTILIAAVLGVIWRTGSPLARFNRNYCGIANSGHPQVSVCSV